MLPKKNKKKKFANSKNKTKLKITKTVEEKYSTREKVWESRKKSKLELELEKNLVKCKSGHVMEYTNRDPYEPVSGFLCSRCMVTKNKHAGHSHEWFYHCRKCHYDICHECSMKAGFADHVHNDRLDYLRN